MGREENIEIYEDTKERCKTDPVLMESIKNSLKNQVLTLEQEAVWDGRCNRNTKPAKIVVSKKRTFEAASAYADKQVCVLNFASATNPGGGVVNGSSAQEECLCRCSTLHFCLNTKEMWDGFYSPHRFERNPLHNDDCIYTPDVVVFKTDTASPQMMKDDDWYNVNVITCAAPNLREKPSNQMNSGDGNKAIKVTDDELQEIHERKLRRILDIALGNGNEVIILGAFGCGAFMNSPEVVAKAMRNVVKEYINEFETIEFAVYCSPRDEKNYRIFDKIMVL